MGKGRGKYWGGGGGAKRMQRIPDFSLVMQMKAPPGLGLSISATICFHAVN